MIFFLSQTYNYIKEPSFINSLSVAVFMPHIPSQYEKLIVGPIRFPKSYREKFSTKFVPQNLFKYAEETLSTTKLLDDIA